MTLFERRQLGKSHVEKYLSSGLGLHEWCKENGVRVDYLRYWLEKSDDNGLDKSWSLVDVIDDNHVDDASSLSVMKNEAAIVLSIGVATIEVRAGFDHSLLSEVLTVVAATC